MFATTQIRPGQFTQISKGYAVSEASMLDLEPGYWPEFLAVLNKDNVGFMFQRGACISNGAELGGYTYWHRQSGMRLDVLND